VKLQRLRIDRLPGIRDPFSIEPRVESPAINVITGENAAGKTSVLRAIRSLLYEALSPQQCSLWGEFVDDSGRTLTVDNNGGRCAWRIEGEPAERPALPDQRLIGCYLLEFEDLAGAERGRDSDREPELAGRIARELAGGYDVHAVRQHFAWSPQKATRPSKDFREAQEELNRIRQAQTHLREREEELEGSRNELAHHRAVAAEESLIQAALEYLDSQQSRAQTEAELDGMPAGMDTLRADDLSALEGLDADVVKETSTLEGEKRARQEAEYKLEASRLADDPIAEDDLGAASKAIERMRTLESTIIHEREHLGEQEAEVGERERELGGAPDSDPAPIDLGAVRRAAEGLAGLRDQDAEIDRLQRMRDALPDHRSETAAIDALQEGCAALREWLSRADAGGWRARAWPDLALLGGGLVVTVGAAIAATQMLVFGWLLVLLLPVAWRWLRRDSGAGAEAARVRFERSAFDAPAVWDRAHVETRLQEFERRLAEAQREEKKLEERETFERLLEAAHRKRDEEASGVGNLAKELGFDPQQLDAGLVSWLQALEAYRKARVARDQSQWRLNAQSTEVGQLRQRVAATLTPYGEQPEEHEPGAEALASGVSRLQKRIQERDSARDAMVAADRRIAESEERLRQAQSRRERFFSERDLGADDRDTLRERLRQLQRWQELKQNLDRAIGAERRTRQPLDEAERSDLVALADNGDRATLQDRKAQAEESRARVEHLQETITRTETEVQSEREQQRLAAAESGVQGARDALEAELDNALYRTAGDVLLAGVEAEIEQVERPAVLEQAQQWFAAFTNHAYELVVRTGEDARFVARETSTGEMRELSELSSGTRMQLILAARLGFAVRAEHDTARLPLFLDEALATTDPGRFREVAMSLRTVAEQDGRQVFYLTADPGELAAWQAALGTDAIHVIDLTKTRTGQSAVSAPDAILVDAGEPLPHPDEVDAGTYVARLQVPPVDPWRGIAQLHLYYILSDRLDLLHRLLAARIRFGGQLQSLLRSGELRGHLDGDERHMLEVRLRAAEAWMSAWRLGRARPVDRAVLEASPLKTSKYLDAVVAQSAELGDDPKALIEGLQDGQIRGVGPTKTRELEDYLRQEGYLPEHTPLESEAIHEHVLRELLTGTDMESAGHLAGHLVRQLDAGVSARAAADA